MAEEPENLVLELLRGMRAGIERMEARLANAGTELDVLTVRVDELTPAASGISQIPSLMSGRADRTDQTIERIGKHLQLEKV